MNFFLHLYSTYFSVIPQNYSQFHTWMKNKKAAYQISIPILSNLAWILAWFCNLCLSGDDWEHEETFTDDDEAVDVDIEERPDLADPEAAPPEIKQVNNMWCACCIMLLVWYH